MDSGRSEMAPMRVVILSTEYQRVSDFSFFPEKLTIQFIFFVCVWWNHKTDFPYARSL